MKLKYIGESFGVDSLTNGKIYEASEDSREFYRVIDDSGEDYLYSKTNPAPWDGSSSGGKWEIISKDLIITKEQIEQLKPYMPNIKEDIKLDINNFLLKLDKIISELNGVNNTYTAESEKLLKLFYDIYLQNKSV